MFQGNQNSVEEARSVLAALSRKFTCTGCGTELKEVFHCDCSHFFCRDCFGINNAIGRCMTCSAPIVSQLTESSPRLVNTIAQSLHQFNQEVGDLDSLPLFMTPEQTSPFATSNGHNNPTKNVVMIGVPSINASSAHSSPEKVESVPDTSHHSTPSSTAPPAPAIDVMPEHDRIHAEASPAEPLASSPALFPSQTTPRLTSTHTLQSNKSVSFSMAEMSNFSAALSTTSSFPITQNSQTNRLLQDITHIKRNILDMLDAAATTPSERPLTDSVPPHPPLSVSRQFSDDCTQWEPPVALQTAMPITEAVDTSEDSNMSQDLLMDHNDSPPPSPPLIRHHSTEETVQEEDADDLPLDSSIPYELPLTMMVDMEQIDQPSLPPVSSSSSSLIRSFTDGPHLPASQTLQFTNKCFVVTAVYRTTRQRTLYESAVQKGWIHASLPKQPPGARVNRIEQKILVTEVVEVRQGQRLTHRSIPYHQALLLGVLIVDFAWLEESLRQHALADPFHFEIAGTIYDRFLRAPLRSRFLARSADGRLELLREYTFYIIPVQDNDLSFNADDIAALIYTAGGQVSEEPVILRTVSARSLPLLLRLRSRKPALHMTSVGYSDYAVSVSWLFDAICNLRVPFDASEYLLLREE